LSFSASFVGFHSTVNISNVLILILVILVGVTSLCCQPLKHEPHTSVLVPAVLSLPVSFLLLPASILLLPSSILLLPASIPPSHPSVVPRCSEPATLVFIFVVFLVLGLLMSYRLLHLCLLHLNEQGSDREIFFFLGVPLGIVVV